MREHTVEYYAPKNFNFMYFFGSLALLLLVNQIVTGIFLAMNFNPTSAGAFASIEYIMRDVEWGWLIRYMHVTGASLLFVVIYLHMFRALMYGSYKQPRELLWVIGMLIYLALMAEAFMGYVLPWGQMSFWGAKVIISLFGAVPVIGNKLVEWIMGDFLPSGATLNRFFALHVIALPLVLLLLVVLHLGALHTSGSNNPDGIEIKQHKGADGKPLDGIPFHPYYTVKDLVGVGFFLLLAAFIIFFQPTFFGLFLEHDNYVPANPLVTPAAIHPVWYFTPFYAMLRSVPSKGLGVITLFAAIAVLFFLPWIDRGKVKAMRYRGASYKIALAIFALTFIWLGKIGIGESTWIGDTYIARALTAVYFVFFLFLWAYTYFGWERTKPVPERVTMHE
ncbi:cytochrome b N-terminal domain-containing protein [Metallibacterium sp.]|uniref:cytochrome b n=1 Tax=Metallibacterium sp. TaxID=2940281 RepID=UPI00260220F5|nr:cytochrome b N-terminal domain-containing protein [Metallibacterium sp.]